MITPLIKKSVAYLVSHAKINRYPYFTGIETITFNPSINWFDFSTSGGGFPRWVVNGNLFALKSKHEFPALEILK